MIVIHPGALNHAASWARVAALFPPGARAAFAEPLDDPPQLFPDEEAAIRQAIPRRQREFALGRWCARAALAELGIAPTPLRVGSDRAPVWPTGTVGSITHCAGFVGAVAATTDQIAALGFDAETAAALDHAVIPMICSAAELDRARHHLPPESSWPKLIFSVKEAIYKCVAPLSGIMLDFKDVDVTFTPSADRFVARLVRDDTDRLPDFSRIEGRVTVSSGVIFATAVIAADPYNGSALAKARPNSPNAP